jgi:hypothetical protein
MLVKLNLIEKAEIYEDLEGTEVANLDEAREEAVYAAREIMAAQLMAGHIDFTPRTEVVNDLGEALMQVKLACIVELYAG